MRAWKYILPAIIILAACQKPPEGTDMHPFTQEELQKKKMDTAFEKFVDVLKLDTVEDVWAEIKANSRISVPKLGILRYTYTKDGVDAIVMDVKLGSFTANLYGGLVLEGQIPVGDGVKVIIDGEQVATLGIEIYEYRDAGKTKRQVTPVFRFPDGTSYAVAGVLLIGPLVDYLMQNVLSTE